MCLCFSGIVRISSEEYAAESVISPIPEEVPIDETTSENAPFKFSRNTFTVYGNEDTRSVESVAIKNAFGGNGVRIQRIE
jgi:hypothetical protein